MMKKKTYHKLMPSQFRNYFSQYYKQNMNYTNSVLRGDGRALPLEFSDDGRVNNNRYKKMKHYSELLNEDIFMLRSAKLFVEKADAIGITEDLTTTVALFFAAMFSPPISITSSLAPSDQQQQGPSNNFNVIFQQKEGHNCYDLYYMSPAKQTNHENKDVEDPGLTAENTTSMQDNNDDIIDMEKRKHFITKLSHQRNSDYEITADEEVLIAKHNKNDLVLYELALRVHKHQVENFRLCKN